MLRYSLLVAALCVVSAVSQSPATVGDSLHNVTYVGYNYSGVEQFQGIRYGQDTSGLNRFKHPQAFSYPNATVVQATAAGASCPQNTIESLASFTENEGVYNLSEDCLNLRMARPAGTKQDAKLPVLVWIYGGSDETGSANYSLYDPTALVLGAAAKGTPLIFVSMNYRVNIFGFANSPAVRAEKSLNSGLLDQRLALEWIQNNIAVFGGNPHEVTLFGESDGGTGVGLQLTAYGGKGESVPSMF
jgi:carboxylesterase type B